MSELTVSEFCLIKHSLCGGKAKRYRNHYAITPGSDNYNTVQSLVERDLMRKIDVHHEIFGDMEMFSVTDSGIKAFEETIKKMGYLES